jgi:hypothetical protein
MKLIIVTMIVTFYICVAIDLPPVQRYLKKQSNIALLEMAKFRYASNDD